MTLTKLTREDAQLIRELRDWIDQHQAESLVRPSYYNSMLQTLLALLKHDLEEAEKFLSVLTPGGHVTRQRLQHWHKVLNPTLTLPHAFPVIQPPTPL